MYAKLLANICVLCCNLNDYLSVSSYHTYSRFYIRLLHFAKRFLSLNVTGDIISNTNLSLFFRLTLHAIYDALRKSNDVKNCKGT